MTTTHTISDEELALGRIYADSMLALAKERNELAVLRDELADLSKFIERDPDFAAFLANPALDEDVRAKTIEKLFRGRYSDLLVDSLLVMNRKGRAGLVPAVAAAFHQALDELEGRIEVQVASAVPLTNELRERVRSVVKNRTQREPELVESVDESLIGGLVLLIGDEKLDGSVSRQLKLLGEALLERASREIYSGRSYVAGAVG